jgi:hypothetical protein
MWTLIDAELRNRFRHHEGVKHDLPEKVSRCVTAGSMTPAAYAAAPIAQPPARKELAFTGGSMHDIIRQLDEKRERPAWAAARSASMRSTPRAS